MEKTPPTTKTINSLHQTHDFMKVDSFSQLPFIRPIPTTTTKPYSSTTSTTPIRLFGIDFSSSSTTATTENSDSGDDSNNLSTSKNNSNINNNNSSNNNNTDTTTVTSSSSEITRKFECHYCCRNFPTSQALGGHQNAHKRERQHAKRAHLQSKMLNSEPTTHHNFYSIASNTYMPHTHLQRTLSTPTPYYPNTNTSLSSTPLYSFHHRHNHHPPTINGSPLGLWRIPTAVHSHSSHHNYVSSMNRDRSLLHPLPLISGSHSNSFSSIDGLDSKGSTNMNMNMNTNMNININMSVNSSHQSQVRCGNGDQVNLDLHL